MEQHFCNCPNTPCPQHPSNHNEGCDPCIRDNLRVKKMPACFFRVVHDDTSDTSDYTIDGFVSYYLKHKQDT